MQLFNRFFAMKQKYIEQEKRLAQLAKAMGHPNRIAILKFLAS
jgi:hypothetical protein